jgi:hypothetical protein
MGQRENIKPGLGGVLMALALAIAPTGMAQAETCHAWQDYRAGTEFRGF